MLLVDFRRYHVFFIPRISSFEYLRIAILLLLLLLCNNKLISELLKTTISFSPTTAHSSSTAENAQAAAAVLVVLPGDALLVRGSSLRQKGATYRIADDVPGAPVQSYT